jgi:polyphosphate glucokinase
MQRLRFGLDIGGSGIKGAVVDVDAGRLTTERVRLPTPQPATPDSVIRLAAQLVREAAYTGPVGCGFPAVIKGGTALTAANIDHSWIGSSVATPLSALLDGRAVAVVNDADAAGLAEMRFGAGRDADGVVVMLTVGTGIGSAVFNDGRLMPNTELGHLEVDGHVAEHRASDAARELHQLSHKQWAERFNRYLEVVERLLWPDLIIVGGGISKAPERFMPHLRARARLVAATLANTAGIIGAALTAESLAVEGVSGT